MEALRSFRGQIESTSPNAHNAFIDESGMLCVTLTMSLPESLLNEDKDVLDIMVNAVFEDVVGYWQVKDGVIEATACYGEPTLFTVHPTRDCYAIYSNDLNLKVAFVVDELHGLALIEQAQRRAGIFGNVIKQDRYGSVTRFWNMSKVSDLTDAQLIDIINEKESQHA
jgi:hypothetical protein